MSSAQLGKVAPSVIPVPPVVARPNQPAVPVPTAIAAQTAIAGSLPVRDSNQVQLEAVIRLAYAASLRAGRDSADVKPKDKEDIVARFNRTLETGSRMDIICAELLKHGIPSLEINAARSQLAGVTPSVPQVILELSQRALDALPKLKVGNALATSDQKNEINLDPHYWSIWQDGEFPKVALNFSS